jgi:uncharacterized protein YjiK
MRHLLGIALLVITAATQSACAPDDADASENAEILQTREARYTAALANADSASADDPIARWMLPTVLSEISGIVLTRDGRMLAHGDEDAKISEVDFKRGVIVKHFLLGDKPLQDDFEGITRIDDRFFLMASTGRLYEFTEGEDKSQVQFRLHEADLSKQCELEGVAYDSTSKSFLLPCKVIKATELKGNIVVFRWHVDSLSAPPTAKITVPLKSAIGSEGWDDFAVSDITVDPKTGNYVLVSAQQKGLIVITPKGEAVSARTLADMHNQVEGVAITSDGVLILSDEIGTDKPAAITMYRWR